MMNAIAKTRAACATILRPATCSPTWSEVRQHGIEVRDASRATTRASPKTSCSRSKCGSELYPRRCNRSRTSPA